MYLCSVNELQAYMKLVNNKITIMNRKTIRILTLLLVAMGLGIGEAKSETVQKVKYMGWDDEQKKLVEMTTPEGVDVTVLEGTETTLGSDGVETWYVTKSEMATFSTITLKPGVHIILADGTTMKVSSGFKRDVVGNDIITIYSQGGTNEGNLTIETTGKGFEILSGNITINGGIIKIEAGSNGIEASWGDVTFNGGKTEITSSGGNGIEASMGNVTFNGGQVTVTSTGDNMVGIKAKYGITFGWKNPTDDFIKCSSYKIPESGSVKTADGKSFAVYDGNDFMCVIGKATKKTFFNNNIGSLSNKTLRPFDGRLLTVGSGKTYYACNLNSSYKPLGNANVYLVTDITYNQSSKQFEAVLSDAQPGVVSGVPVIFGVTSGNLPESIALENDATVSLSATPSKNFIACNGTKKVSELLPSGVNFADVYFFGLSGNSFKRVLLGSDDVHPAGTCFLFISKDDFNNPPSSAPAGARGIGIETDGTTSLIGNGQLTTDHAASAQWYSLDGRRLDKAPKAKGVYIRNGKKLVIK